ncbi:hypothetical protein [Isoptericola sp. NPDC057191]|uniref:hypothetical protein n=1 Tax=Isoptericola sp. NPDC057191 TaxID=3346041 RepID=UPI00362DDC06
MMRNEHTGSRGRVGRRLAALTVAVVTVASLAACSSGDDGEATASPSTTQQQAQDGPNAKVESQIRDAIDVTRSAEGVVGKKKLKSLQVALANTTVALEKLKQAEGDDVEEAQANLDKAVKELKQAEAAAKKAIDKKSEK